MLEYICFHSREEWLEGRKAIQGIGGSEAAAVFGASKWKTPLRLWEEKTGRRKPKEMSGVDYVDLGIQAEAPLRSLFSAIYPEYDVGYRPYDILYQTERPWLFATLDGELTEKESGRRGVLEIKKYEISNKADWKAWDGQIPMYYYCQILHQFLASGFDFAYLWAMLLRRNGEAILRPYYFEREYCDDDMLLLLAREEGFMECVAEDRMPGAILHL